jgi:hypothetical protein
MIMVTVSLLARRGCDADDLNKRGAMKLASAASSKSRTASGPTKRVDAEAAAGDAPSSSVA